MRESGLKLQVILIGTVVVSLGILMSREAFFNKNMKGGNNERTKKTKNGTLSDSSKTKEEIIMKEICSNILNSNDENIPKSSSEFIRKVYESAFNYNGDINEELMSITPKNEEELSELLVKLGLSAKYARKVIYKLPEVEVISRGRRKKAKKSVGKEYLQLHIINSGKVAEV